MRFLQRLDKVSPRFWLTQGAVFVVGPTLLWMHSSFIDPSDFRVYDVGPAHSAFLFSLMFFWFGNVFVMLGVLSIIFRWQD